MHNPNGMVQKKGAAVGVRDEEYRIWEQDRLGGLPVLRAIHAQVISKATAKQRQVALKVKVG